MDVFLGVFIAIISIFLVLTLRSLTTFFHEMGHAIPALLFTKGDVIVFIGTYQDLSGSFSLRIGRLHIYFRLNLFNWEIGLCSYKKPRLVWQELLITLGGPIASLLIAIPLFSLVLTQNFSDIPLTIVLIFVVAAAIDFFVNIYPSSKAIQMHNGVTTYNDGYQIYLLLGRLSLPKHFFEIEENFKNRDYQKVIADCEELIIEKQHKRAIYELLAKAYVKEKKYDDAIYTYKRLRSHLKFKYQNYREMGNIYRQKNNYEEALKHFNYCLHIDYKDAEVLVDKAYLSIQQGEYDTAIADLDAAIFYSPEAENAYLNRGLAQIRLRNYKEAHADLMVFESMNTTNPLLPYYVGMLHEKQHRYDKALESYKKAKAMKIENIGIDYLIATMEEQL